MAISEVELARVTQLITSFCDRRVPPSLRHQVRLGFRIDGHTVDLLESRPYFQPPHDWRHYGVARFRYVASRRVWKLYCQHRDLKWHEYKPLPEGTFERLLKEVDRDPTRIFWG